MRGGVSGDENINKNIIFIFKSLAFSSRYKRKGLRYIPTLNPKPTEHAVANARGDDDSDDVSADGGSDRDEYMEDDDGEEEELAVDVTPALDRKARFRV